MSYPVKKYKLDGSVKTIDNVQLSLSNIFNNNNGREVLNLLVKEYFSLTAKTTEDLWKIEGVRSFIQMVIDTNLIVNNCSLINIDEEKNGK